MPSQPKEWSDWLIEALKREIETFNDSTTSLLPLQKTAFDLCCNLLRENAESLAKRSSSSRSIRHRARGFLKDIFLDLGPEVFLLCILAVPITNLGKIATHTRLSEVSSWWETAPRPQGLLAVTKELCKANSINALIPSSQNIQAQGSGVGVQQEITKIPELSSNDPNITTAQEQLVLQNASLGGIAEVFNGYMCDAIRRVTVDSDLKAAITMVFPGWGGLVDCVMSLDVYEGVTAQLAMALFNAEVKWMGGVLHVVLSNGMTLSTETSEFTLKGVEDRAINKVFGPEIHDAVTECPIRRREFTEGKHVTECVSMNFTKNGAIINLSLGIRAGLQIQNKLCT